MDERLPAEGVVVATRYRIGRRLGSGAMGVVFEAEDTFLGRVVALKMLSTELHEEEHLARFEREARAVARLNDPNVVAVSDFVRDPTWGPGIVLERLVGESLEARLSRLPPLSEAEIVDVAVQALGAIQHAHAAGVIHRDLKPSNLFLVTLANGLVVTKLLDFGVAKLLDDGGHAKLTAAGMTVGTPSYMPPEQALGASVDARIGVYAMGAVLYEALAGLPPYDGEPMHIVGAILAGPPEPITRVAPHVSPELAAIVTRAMERMPEHRFPTAEAMRDALRRVRLQPARDRERAVRATRSDESLPATRIAEAPAPRASTTKARFDTGPIELPTRSRAWLGVGALAMGIALVAWAAWSFASAPPARPQTIAPAPSVVREPVLVPAPTPSPPAIAPAPSVEPATPGPIEAPAPVAPRPRVRPPHVPPASPTPDHAPRADPAPSGLGDRIIDPFAG